MTDAETGEGLTDQQIRDEVVNLFLAGYDTTAATLTWALALLLRHPQELMRLRTEVDEVLAGRTPTFADATRLVYTRMVVHETLRLRPAAWQVPRIAIEDDVIDGYAIPAGTVVIPLIYMIHRHPEHWSAPEEFDPQRFTPGRSDTRHHFSYIPFGAGQRTCIGKDFSLLESQLVLSSVFSRFTLEPTTSALPQPRMSATLKMHGTVSVRLKRRAP